MKQIKTFFTLTALILTTTLSAHEVHIWEGSHYHNNSASQQKTAEYLIEKFKFDGNEAILDVGCGDGKVTAQLSKKVPGGQIMGLDLSPSMIDFATAHFPNQSYHNLSFLKGDACALPFKEQFDVIFSFTTLQWAMDHKQVLAGMHKALKRTGSIAISMPIGLPLSLQQAVEELIAQPNWRGYFVDFETGFNFISQEEYTVLLKEHGFQINLIETRTQHDVFANSEQLIDFMSQWFPYLRPLPLELKSKFMVQLIQRYCELEEQEINQQVSFSPKHLTVIAHKI